MKNALCLSAAALALFTIALPMQADAADRQISVKQKKFTTFTVDDSSQLDSIGKTADTAEANSPKIGVKEFRVDDSKRADANPQDVKPKAFRVKDNQRAEGAPKIGKIQSVTVVDDDSAEVKPAPQPRKPKTLRFKVKDQSEQALSAPVQDETDETADVQSEESSNVLNQEVKLVKKPKIKVPAVETDEEEEAPADDQTEEAAAPEDDHSADIAADTNAEEATDPNELRYYVLKKKHYNQAKADYSYQEPTYTYQEPSYSGYQEPTYTGSSCHNDNNY